MTNKPNGQRAKRLTPKSKWTKRQKKQNGLNGPKSKGQIQTEGAKTKSDNLLPQA